MENQLKSLIIQSLKIGAFFGLINIIITLLIYILNVNMMSIGFFIGYLIFSIILTIIFFVYGMKNIRDNYLNGVISFGYKFLTGLIIGIVSGWIAGIIGIILYVYYDPGFIVEQIDELIIKLEDMGLEETVIDKQESDIRKGFTLTGQLKTMFINTPIFTVILSLIVSALVKKEKNSDSDQVL